MLCGKPVPVNNLKSHNKEQWKKPLPERRVPVLVSMNKDQDVHNDGGHPMDQVKSNESHLLPEERHSADTHDPKEH